MDRGAHDLRFGTNTRILRLNDYDFGEGTVPTVTYTICRSSSMESRRPRRRRFPLRHSQPFNFLNLDLYAQDTWKLTANADLDFRRARHIQFQPAESS